MKKNSSPEQAAIEEEPTDLELPEEKREHKANDDSLLVPIETYLKSGIHIGTKFKTKYMEAFIYKARPDGLFVLNLQRIDERLRVCATFLAQYQPEDVLVISRRENGWKPVRVFGKVTGIKVIPGRYPPGILTNLALKTFIQPKLLLVTDAWPDRNAVHDATKAGIPIIGLNDTNNQANSLDLVVPCNNKGKKSLGLFFWILAKEYLKARGESGEFKETIEDFTEQ
ncbi:30S ribosomal protein S2 [Candidatus Woesearchaeota archaeon]|nr:30S ribosomal protein S2 [Candidatus Woesearchaeota archaeon]